MSSTSASIERPYGWVVATVSLVMMCIGTGSTYLSVVALKPIAAEFGWPRAVPSLAYSLGVLGMGVGGVLIGRVADRIGVAVPAFFGALMIAFGAWLASIADSAFELYLAHGLFMGVLGNGALFAPLIANTTRWFDRRRGIAVALVASGQQLAGAIWPPIHEALIASVGWRQTYFLFAIASAIGMLPLAFLLRPRPPAAIVTGIRDRSDASHLVLGLHPELVQTMLSAAIIGCCIAMAMPIVHLIAHATDLGHAPARAAEMLGLLLLCGFVSRLLFGFLADRIGGVLSLLIGAAAQALTLGLFLVVDGLLALYLAAAAFGLAFGGIVPCYALIIRELFPVGEVGWRIGAIFLFGTIGMAVGGWLGGLIFDLGGSYHPAFLVGIAFNLGNLVLVGAIAWRQRGLGAPQTA